MGVYNMTELIKIEKMNDGRQAVSAKELYRFFTDGDIKHYSRWIKQNITNNAFAVENEDYIVVATVATTSKGGRQSQDYILTLDFAKELCMLQRTEKGKQARQYFIKCEKQLQAKQDSYLIADPIERAKAWIVEQEQVRALTTTVKVQEQQINELKPKASYYDTILQNKSLMTITQIAKDYGMTARKMNELLHSYKIQYKQSNQWLLYTKYQTYGYTSSQTMTYVKTDGTDGISITTKWTQKGRLFLYAFLKNKNVLPLIEQD
jgi:anti-repressor protein